MNKRRQDRMAVEIKRSLSQLLQEDIKDPRIDFGTVSITRVDVSNDLGHARIISASWPNLSVRRNNEGFAKSQRPYPQ